jgi:hypothetical protein
MQIVADQPVVWSPAVTATVATLTKVSQAVIDPVTLRITFSGAVSGHAYTVPAGAGRSYLGGATPAASGTF